MHFLRILGVAAFIAAIACVGPATNPPTGPGTDYPCGLQGHSCGNHMCCWLDEDCGGQNPSADGKTAYGCPAKMCCYNGEDTYVAPGGRKAGRKYNDAGKREPHTQLLDMDMINGKIVEW
jgi:hypothetical protein